MAVDDLKRLKELETEIATLKRLLADAEVEKAALKAIAEENPEPAYQSGCRAPTDHRAGFVGA